MYRLDDMDETASAQLERFTKQELSLSWKLVALREQKEKIEDEMRLNEEVRKQILAHAKRYTQRQEQRQEAPPAVAEEEEVPAPPSPNIDELADILIELEEPAPKRPRRVARKTRK